MLSKNLHKGNDNSYNMISYTIYHFTSSTIAFTSMRPFDDMSNTSIDMHVQCM